MLHWASLIIFFALSVLALWVSHTYLQKNGLYFFGIVASIVCAYFPKVELFYKALSVQMVVLPVILLALYIAYSKYDKAESIRLFFVLIFSQITMFVIRFFEYAFLDLSNGVFKYLSWAYLNNFVATTVALLVCSICGYLFVEYVKMEKLPKIIRTSIYLGIFSIINSLIFITIAYAGYYSFVEILLTFLLYIAFNIVLAVILGCLEWLVFSPENLSSLNRKTSKGREEKKQEDKNKKLSNYFDNKDDKKNTLNKPSSSNKISSSSNYSKGSSSNYSSKSNSTSRFDGKNSTKPSSSAKPLSSNKK